MQVMQSKLAGLLGALRERSAVHRTGNEWRTRCPAHDDRGPSLYVRLQPDAHNILIRCNSGCDPDDIMSALDLEIGDLFFEEDEPMVEVNGDFEAIALGLEHDNLQLSLRATSAGPSADEGPIELADVDRRHRVYSLLLDRLELSEPHKQALHQRGLTEEVIDRNGYRSLDRYALNQAVGQLKQLIDEQSLLTVPGFRIDRGRVRFTDIEGLIVPVRDRDGRIIALKLRRDDPGEGPKFAFC